VEIGHLQLEDLTERHDIPSHFFEHYEPARDWKDEQICAGSDSEPSTKHLISVGGFEKVAMKTYRKQTISLRAKLIPAAIVGKLGPYVILTTAKIEVRIQVKFSCGRAERMVLIRNTSKNNHIAQTAACEEL